MRPSQSDLISALRELERTLAELLGYAEMTPTLFSVLFPTGDAPERIRQDLKTCSDLLSGMVRIDGTVLPIREDILQRMDRFLLTAASYYPVEGKDSLPDSLAQGEIGAVAVRCGAAVKKLQTVLVQFELSADNDSPDILSDVVDYHPNEDDLRLLQSLIDSTDTSGSSSATGAGGTDSHCSSFPEPSIPQPPPIRRQPVPPRPRRPVFGGFLSWFFEKLRGLRKKPDTGPSFPSSYGRMDSPSAPHPQFSARMGGSPPPPPRLSSPSPQQPFPKTVPLYGNPNGAQKPSSVPEGFTPPGYQGGSTGSPGADVHESGSAIGTAWPRPVIWDPELESDAEDQQRPVILDSDLEDTGALPSASWDSAPESDTGALPDLSRDSASEPITRELPPVDPLPSEQPLEDDVQFRAVAPASLTRGEWFLLKVMMYEGDDWERADREAARVADDIAQDSSGLLPVQRGREISIQLQSSDVSFEEDTQTMIWSGRYTCCSFEALLPEDFPRKQVRIRGRVRQGLIVLTDLRLILKVEATPAAAAAAPSPGPAPTASVPIEQCVLHSAFLSYASQDRARVSACIRGILLVRPDLDLFFDVVSLRRGERYADRIFKEIESRDLFYLFWSIYAAQSDWVRRELNYALEHLGADHVEPVPLDPPDLCPPPASLEDRHFNDWILRYEQSEASQYPPPYNGLWLQTEKGCCIRLPPTGGIIGRNMLGSEILKNVRNVSRSHISVKPLPNGTLQITDMNTTNGTQINGISLKPYEPAIAEPGDRITLGTLSLVLMSRSAQHYSRPH